MSTKKHVLASLFATALAYPLPVMAQTLPSCEDVINPIKWPHCTFSIVGNLLVTFIDMIIIVGALYAFWNTIQGALQYMTSSSSEQMGKARSNISWSIGGLFGLAASFALFRLIISFIPNVDSYI